MIQGMRDSEASLLFSCFQVRRSCKEIIVYGTGEESENRLHLIIEGKVSAISHSPDIYSILGAGDVYGLFSFLDENRPHSASVKVLEDIITLTLDRSYFDLLTVEEPQTARQLFHFMFKLLSRTSLKQVIEYSEACKYHA
ncbi:MAG: cyclic nucleotide-binding domain-containing protein [Mariprofundaceae bacterium]